MATQALFPDEANVELMKKDDVTKYNVTVDVDTYEESGFERDTESRPFFGGAKVVIEKPQADGEIKFNAKLTRPLWDQIFWGGTGSDFTSSGAQDEWRIVFMVTKDPAFTNAGQDASNAVGSAYDTYRKVYVEARATSWNPKLEAEGMLEGEITFKLPPRDEVGSPNVRVQFQDSVTGLGFDALNNYTSTVKW